MRYNHWRWFLVLLVIVSWQHAASFDFVFEPTWNPEDFCFYEEIEKGGVLTGNFHVLDPEDSRIDVELYKVNPEGPPELKWESRGAQRGRISFKAEDGGTYKTCFRSGDITTSRLVSFVAKTGFEGTVEVEAMNALQVGQIEKTYESLTSLQRELDSALASQYYLRTRLLKHEKTVISTNRAVLIFLLLKTLFVASLVAVKLYFVKRLFDDPKRVRMRHRMEIKVFREIGGFTMSVDTSKLWAIGALSASVCVITSIVAYYTWSHLHGKNTSSLFTNESTKKKRKPKKKKKKSRASSNSTESINDNGNIAIGHEENSAESSEWIQVRPRRRKSKAKE